VFVTTFDTQKRVLKSWFPWRKDTKINLATSYHQTLHTRYLWWLESGYWIPYIWSSLLTTLLVPLSWPCSYFGCREPHHCLTTLCWTAIRDDYSNSASLLFRKICRLRTLNSISSGLRLWGISLSTYLVIRIIYQSICNSRLTEIEYRYFWW
jgi:hypothetical protein